MRCRILQAALIFLLCLVVTTQSPAQYTVPLLLEHTIELPSEPVTWDVMPRGDGYYYWVSAHEYPEEATQIYWGHDFGGLVDSYILEAGSPKHMEGFFRAGREPYFVLCSRYNNGTDSTLYRIYRLSDGESDPYQWYFESYYETDPYGGDYYNHEVSNHRLMIAVPVFPPPEICSRLIGVVCYDESEGGSSSSTDRRGGYVLLDMLAGENCPVSSLPSGGQTSFALLNERVFLGIGIGYRLVWYGNDGVHINCYQGVRGIEAEPDNLLPVLGATEGSGLFAWYGGDVACAYDISNDRLVVAGRVGNRRSAWAAGVGESIWDLEINYAVLLEARVMPEELNEQILAFDLDRQVFDIINIEDGSLFGQTGEIDADFEGIRVVGRYHDDHRRLAVRYGNEIRLYRFGTSIPVNPQQAVHPDGYALYQNYPNPFNPATSIAFDLPTAVQVSLRVYDITGREVATPADDVYPAGHHELAFDGGSLPSGVYFYRLQAGSFTECRKMVLLK